MNEMGRASSFSPRDTLRGGLSVPFIAKPAHFIARLMGVHVCVWLLSGVVQGAAPDLRLHDDSAHVLVIHESDACITWKVEDDVNLARGCDAYPGA